MTHRIGVAERIDAALVAAQHGRQLLAGVRVKKRRGHGWRGRGRRLQPLQVAEDRVDADGGHVFTRCVANCGVRTSRSDETLRFWKGNHKPTRANPPFVVVITMAGLRRNDSANPLLPEDCVRVSLLYFLVWCMLQNKS